MRGIITVLGGDQVGIIAKVCTFLADRNVNILDISQTIVQNYFNMLMIVDISGIDLNTLIDGLDAVGLEMGVHIKFQHEDIFKSMHRL
ncbi:UPF0237 protein [Clostridia bacterium]|nr:UPF0237 protein [Clostridia bacterium]